MQVSHIDERVTHAVIGGSKTIDFGISDSPEFFHILSSTLYTDQRLAVIREVMCNAWDAHIASGRTNLPVEVTLKDNQIMIRDFGYGIAHDDMGHIYGTYGNSTKQNDGKQTGGFGLGCKAPFAYSDHFQVVSYNKGTKTIYALSKSSAVVGGKPGITPIVSMPTEESGLSVSIPVKSGSDGHYFIQKLKELVLFGDMFVTFNGDVLPKINFNTEDGAYYLLTSKLHSNTINVRYGNVVYPVNECPELDVEMCDARAKLLKIRSLNKSFSLLLQAPPHSISVTPSRESLSMQENTIKTLKDLLVRFINEYNPKTIHQTQLQVIKDGFKDPLVDNLVNDAFKRDVNSTFFRADQKEHLRNLYEAVQSTMQVDYPQKADVRFLEIKERINLLIRLGKVPKHLGLTFLDAYKEDLKDNLGNMFNRHYYMTGAGNNKWFFKVYAKSIIRKMQTSTLSLDRLYISDNRQVNKNFKRVEGVYKLTSANFISINDCLPYLRNIVVLNTSCTVIKEGNRVSDGKNHVTAGSGFLFYHVGMKKNDEQEALDFWKATGMTVINMCGLNPTIRSASTKPKKAKQAGYPLLSNVWHNGKINVKRLEGEPVTYTTTPEFYVRASTNNENYRSINFFYGNDELYFKYYGSKGVVITNPRTEEVLQRKGIPNLWDYIAKDIAAYITDNAAIFKHVSMSHKKIYQHFRGFSPETANCIRQILVTPTLVDYFKLNSSLSEKDSDYLSMLYSVSQIHRISSDNSQVLFGLVESLNKVPVAQEVEDFLKVMRDNPVVDFIDIAVFQRRFAEAGDDQTKDLLLNLFKTMLYL